MRRDGKVNADGNDLDRRLSAAATLESCCSTVATAAAAVGALLADSSSFSSIRVML